MQSYTIMDTVIDLETGVNIACIVDTGCGPPSIIEKRLVQILPELLLGDDVPSFSQGPKRAPQKQLASEQKGLMKALSLKGGCPLACPLLAFADAGVPYLKAPFSVAVRPLQRSGDAGHC
jgi:hypothetical protein